jgi:hypothetical protein
MTRKEVMSEIEKKIQSYTIRILGNKKDKVDGFYILMNTQPFYSDEKNVYHGIKNDTLKLLKRAEIKYKIIER